MEHRLNYVEARVAALCTATRVGTPYVLPDPLILSHCLKSLPEGFFPSSGRILFHHKALGSAKSEVMEMDEGSEVERGNSWKALKAGSRGWGI